MMHPAVPGIILTPVCRVLSWPTRCEGTIHWHRCRSTFLVLPTGSSARQRGQDPRKVSALTLEHAWLCQIRCLLHQQAKRDFY